MSTSTVDRSTTHHAGAVESDAPRDGWRVWLFDSALVSTVTTVALVLVMRLWDMPLRVPLLYQRDGISFTANVKGIIEHGWYQTNPSLGFPFGQNLGDFPLGDGNAHFLALKVIGFFSNDAVLVTNLYYLLSFVLVSLAAFFVLRYLAVGRWFALTGAVLFTFLPYHFLRGTWHLLLAAYWSVPIACLMIVLIQRDPPPFFRREAGRLRLDLKSRRTALFVLGAVVIGSTSVYYAAFTVVLGGTLAILRSLAARDWRPAVAVAGLCLAIGATLIVNNVESILYQREHGHNDAVLIRGVAESDLYALRPIQMIVPIPGHRIELFAKVAERSLSAPNNSEGSSYLGIFGTLGFVALGGALLTNLVGRARSSLDELPLQLVAPTLLALGFGVTGGLSWGFGLAGFAEIRSWNRLSVFIAFFCLAALTWWLTRLLPRVSWMRARRWAIPAVALSLIVVGVLDQTSDHVVPDSKRFEAEFESDRRFVRRVERALEPGDAVYEVPYLPFPEAEGAVTRFGMIDYDPLRGYLHSDTLRWGYAGVRGREGDWQEQVSGWPPRDLVAAITAVGFDGLWIDRFGYRDRARALEAELRDVVGSEPLVSEGDRFAFFSLRGASEAQRDELGAAGVAELRRQALAAPIVRLAGGVEQAERGVADTTLVGSADARLAVVNRTDRRQDVVVRGLLRSSSGEAGSVEVRMGDQAERVAVTADALPFELRFRLAPGEQLLELTTRLPAAGGGRFLLEDLEVVPTD